MKTVADIAARRLEKANVRMVDLRRAAAQWKKTLEPIICSVESKVILSGVELLNVLHGIVTEEKPKGYIATTYWCDKKVAKLSTLVATCRQQTESHRQFLQSSENSAVNEWSQEVQAMEKALTALKVDSEKRAEKKSDELREEHLKKLSAVETTLGMGCMGLLAGGAIFIVVVIIGLIFSDALEVYAKTPLWAQFDQAAKSNGAMGFINLIPTVIDQWKAPEFWWAIATGFGFYGWKILPFVFFAYGIVDYIRRVMKIDRMVKLEGAKSKEAIAGELEEKRSEITNLQKKVSDYLPTNRLHITAKEKIAELLDALSDVAAQLLKYNRQSGE